MPSPTPLQPAECTLLAAFLTRAIANEQLAIHHQALDARGAETDNGVSCTNSAWQAKSGHIEFDDDSRPIPGVHLYVAGSDLDYLVFED